MPYMAEKQQTINSHNLALLLLVETGVMVLRSFHRPGQGAHLRMAGRNGPLGLLPWLAAAMSIGGLPSAADLCFNLLACDRLFLAARDLVHS